MFFGPLDYSSLVCIKLLGCNVGAEQFINLREIMRTHPKLESLCGIYDEATAADFSGCFVDGDDAGVIAAELPRKTELGVLNIGRNGSILGPSGTKSIAEALEKNVSFRVFFCSTCTRR